MNNQKDNSFVPGCYHVNRQGWYFIRSASEHGLLCEYLTGGEFTASATWLKKVEFRELGYNLHSPQKSLRILSSYKYSISDLTQVEIIKTAGSISKEACDMRDQMQVQNLYERQLSQVGVRSAKLRKSTVPHRESGCHKCKKKPLISKLQYECPICIGIACRDCGSCFCNKINL